jgi:hypothetical protein
VRNISLSSRVLDRLLSCDFFRDQDETICCGPKRFITKLIDQHQNMFGCKPREYTSPFKKRDHPEVDGIKDTKQQSFVFNGQCHLGGLIFKQQP